MNKIIIPIFLLGLITQAGFSQCNENTVWERAWYSCKQQPSPGSTEDLTHWILYDLGAVYALGESHIWNLNQADELDRGFRQVRIGLSTDSLTWFTLGEFEFEQGDGSASYSGFEGPDFQGIEVRYVLLEALSNWGDPTCSGITEVQFNLSDNAPTPVQSPILAGSVIVYPNPARDHITLSYSSTQAETWHITLHNLLGQEIAEASYELSIGNNRLEFPLVQVPGGTYWLSAKNDENIHLYGQRVLVAP